MWTLLLLCLCPLVSVVSPCPAGCCCPGSLVLCESLGLRSLPRSVPVGTSALSVARNQLCNVDHQFLSFSGLQELSLGHNLLSHFPRGLPPSLESLQLQENRIAYVTSGALRKLGNLTHLDLKDNCIRAIQPGALQSLTRLQVLALKGNRLTGLPRSLPPSLTHVDLSENCVAALDPPSLSPLVHLQSLKINSICLRWVPESGLRSLDHGVDLWACRCDALHLYRFPPSGRVRTATDVPCTEAAPLPQQALLNLSAPEVCPDPTLEGSVTTFENATKFDNQSRRTSKPADLERRLLGSITYEKCVSLTKTPPAGPSLSKTTVPDGQQKFRDNATGRQPDPTSSEQTRPLLSTDSPTPLPRAPARPGPAVVVALLALACGLLLVLSLVLLILLKRALLRQRRVAPLEAGSGR